MNWRKRIGYPLIVWKNGSREYTYGRYLTDHEKITKDERRRIALQRLVSLLRHAAETVPYYQEIFAESGFDPAAVASLSDISPLPLLTKRIIQERRDDLVSARAARDRMIRDQTGGSTASPLVFFYDEDRLDWRKAAESRHNGWVGVERGMKCAALWGARRDFGTRQDVRSRVRTFLTTHTLILDASSITDDAFDSFIERLNRFKPDYLLAYARTLSYFARYIKDTGKDVPSPGRIITSAEVLTPQDRLLIEEVFRSRVYDRYGCREVGVIASECDRNVMHRDEDCLYTEFLRPDGAACAPGEEGRVIITDLLNYTMPLIRYEIGDTGVPTDVACSCGRTLGSMRMAAGRTTDFIITPTGRRVSGAAITAYVITNIDGIGRVQLFQKEQSRLTVKVVPNKRFTPDTLCSLERRIRDFLDDIDPAFEVVADIDMPGSGKMQFCVNELLRGRS